MSFCHIVIIKCYSNKHVWVEFCKMPSKNIGKVDHRILIYIHKNTRAPELKLQSLHQICIADYPLQTTSQPLPYSVKKLFRYVAGSSLQSEMVLYVCHCTSLPACTAYLAQPQGETWEKKSPKSPKAFLYLEQTAQLTQSPNFILYQQP